MEETVEENDVPSSHLALLRISESSVFVTEGCENDVVNSVWELNTNLTKKSPSERPELRKEMPVAWGGGEEDGEGEASASASAFASVPRSSKLREDEKT
mmetsp:Transcript_29988/g.41440  ORF Transcript_29988/g.41440 Transcript_29988/m.41440 type:complete len:99 (-) Transcript_29988:718-1014(-)